MARPPRLRHQRSLCRLWLAPPRALSSRGERGAGATRGPSRLYPRVGTDHSRRTLGRSVGLGRGEGHLPRPLIAHRRDPMIQLTLQMAETAVRAAHQKAKALGSPMTVTVVD